MTISSTTSGATLCYTTDGSSPAASAPGTCSSGTSLVNGGTVTVSASETLEAIGTESGFANSGIASAAYTLSTQSNGCDLNGDGVVNSADVTLAVNMALGTAPCTATVEGPDVCTVVTVQRVINASLGQTCITYNLHAATLSWVASTSPNIAGYNVYRGTVSGGPYTQMNSSLVTTGTAYTDTSVGAGQTYYYVVTAVSTSGTQSSYSTQATAVIPTP